MISYNYPQDVTCLFNMSELQQAYAMHWLILASSVLD